MVDTYIDPNETLIYGPFAREQIEEHVMPLLEPARPYLLHCIEQQRIADERMQDVLARVPEVAVDAENPTADARDLVTRFAGYVVSIKGQPVPLRSFFGSEPPSKLARRRPLKLVAALRRMHATLHTHRAKMPGSDPWLAELADAVERLDLFERAKRAKRAGEVDVRPEIQQERARWLEVYATNKIAVESVLRHVQRLHLMPVIFDDIAEVHRTRGTTDDDGGEGGEGGET